MSENQDHITPPRWSLRLLRLFIRQDYLEEIEGDMEEVFYDELDQYSASKCRRRYNLEVLKLMRPAIIKSILGSQKLNYLGMLQHNLLITFRGFKRHKTSFLINLIGLSTGLAAALLIFLWVKDERSVDTFHQKNNQLYWVMTNFRLPSGVLTWDYTPGPLAKSMLENMPEVEASVRVGNSTYFQPRGVLSFEENNFEIAGLFADPNFFEIMTYDVIQGNPGEIIDSKESIAISESLAMKVFGSLNNVIGQTIDWESQFFSKTFNVSAIYKDPPTSATRQFEAVINYDILIEIDEWADEWNGSYAETYLVLKEETDISEFNDKIADYLHGKIGNHDRFTMFVNRYADNYLYSQYKDGELVGGRIDNVRLFSFVAIFILFIACINFMNLATAQASKKMKEVGVKKAIGANRTALAVQFLSESLILSLTSLIISIGIIGLCLPQFNQIIGKQLEFDLLEYLQPMLITVFVTGIIAGSYPALYLSGFKPVEVLKGKLTNLTGEIWIRKGLVITQFVLSIIFITGVVIINRQIEFTQTKDLGYDRNNVVTFTRKGTQNEDPTPLLNELNKISGIMNVSNMAGPFLWGNDSQSGYSWKDGKDDDEFLFKSPKIGFNVIETMGLEILSGRSFSADFNDTNDKIIINESAVKLMELENPIGSKLKNGDEFKEIIGVVKDFHYGSMHQKIQPMIFRFRNTGNNFLIKLKAGTEVLALGQIEKVYETFHPKYDFQATFIDDAYNRLYDSESKVASLSNYMALIAIIISSLGLFGLAAFTAERRTKEIGIRKILGASQLVIIRLLTGSFTKTVIISIVIALPISYVLAQNWLQSFAYSIDLSWWIFALAGVSALIISWVTVGFQTFKTALINPVECLRDE